jgi:hypothetical protein
MAKHTTAMDVCPPPQDIKHLQCFLGTVNLYRHFIPRCTQVWQPLTDLPKSRIKILEWTTAAEEAFQSAKPLPATAVPLQHTAPNDELSLATDTSDSHIVSVMQQKLRPLGFFSKKLNPAESH